MREGFIYIMQTPIALVKIGFSICPKGRAGSLQQACPYPVRLVAYWPGNQYDERAYHAQFREHHHHGEWFREEGSLAEFVKEQFGLNVDDIVDWSDIPRMRERSWTEERKAHHRMLLRLNRERRPAEARP